MLFWKLPNKSDSLAVRAAYSSREPALLPGSEKDLSETSSIIELLTSSSSGMGVSRGGRVCAGCRTGLGVAMVRDGGSRGLLV